MRLKISVLATAVAMAFAGAASADDLRIATEGAYPPFNEKNAAGELIGFDVDIAKALCAEMNRTCVIVAQDWDGIIPGLVNNKYDAIVASMSITEERLNSIDFTSPYYSNYIALIAKNGSGFTMDDVARQPIGAQRSTVASEWAEENAGSRGDVKLYDTQTAAYSDLEAGRIDALVSDYLPATEWLKENEGYGLVGGKIDIDDKIGIGLRKGEDDLKAAFDKALAAIRENGTYAKISEEYFGVDIF
jgi:lysine-arginine-ornithine-binding protein